MQLSAGTRLGPYEVVSALGAGGMGEVYRARDTQLNRDVAIKVLPELFAQDHERLARFTREAQTLAALNHPNIAHIHGLEGDGSAGRPRALVMELVDGEDLSAVIARGPMPLADALPIARQIADALEAAHDLGIVHRDLKPANIKVRADSAVKVLDFGLAKAAEPSDASPNMANSPTMAMTGTRTGLILGTAGYMAPEQARGQAVDRRADIWAFGVVLFEMLAGTQAFRGDTISDVLASVLKNDLDWRALPQDLPVAILQLLRRCLDPDRKNRLRDIGEARILLSQPIDSAAASAAGMPPAASRSRLVNRLLLAFSALLALSLFVALVSLWRRAAPTAADIVRFEVLPPDSNEVTMTVRPSVSISPDGATIAYTASSTTGISSLHVRRLDSVESRQIPGTEEASNPVFSPDGRSLAIFAGKKLLRVPLDGQVVPLATVNDPRGLTWLDGTAIVFNGEAAGGLMRISADGGEPAPVTTLNTQKRERTHRWPSALPQGKAVLFTVGTEASPDDYDSSDIEAVTVATGERHVVLRGASMAAYSPSGHLIVTRGGTLYAAPFDLDGLRVTGNLVPVVQGVMGDRTTGAVHFSVASIGTLAYVPGTSIGDQHVMLWVDVSAGPASANTKTVTTSLDLPRAAYNDPAISPDGSRVAFIQGITGVDADVWIYDFGRKSMTRLTFDERNAAPTWSSDGRTIYYSSIVGSGSKATFMRKPADGSREAEPVGSVLWRAYLRRLMPDGTAIVESTQISGSERSISRVRLTPGKSDPVALEPIVSTRADEYGSAVSPDDRFLAYSSDESGRPEIYVRDLSGSGGRWQISTSGGEEPHWSADSRRLYYRQEGGLYSVPVETRNGFSAAMPQLIFRGAYSLRTDTGLTYDVDPITGRILMIRPIIDEKARTSVRVVLNWFDELRAKFGR